MPFVKGIVDRVYFVEAGNIIEFFDKKVGTLEPGSRIGKFLSALFKRACQTNNLEIIKQCVDELRDEFLLECSCDVAEYVYSLITFEELSKMVLNQYTVILDFLINQSDFQARGLNCFSLIKRFENKKRPASELLAMLKKKYEIIDDNLEFLLQEQVNLEQLVTPKDVYPDDTCVTSRLYKPVFNYTNS